MSGESSGFLFLMLWDLRGFWKAVVGVFCF
jgi:hypothetical protein